MKTGIPKPKRSKSQAIGDDGAAKVISLLASGFAVNEITKNDFGCDLRAELDESGTIPGIEGFVQVKSTRKVTPNKAGMVTVNVSAATVNYWISKIRPIFILKIETTTGKLWGNPLSEAFDGYPHLISEARSAPIRLAPIEDGRLPGLLGEYISDFFERLTSDLNNLPQALNIARLHFISANLYRFLTEFFLEINGSKSEADIESIWMKLLLTFGESNDALDRNWNEFISQQDVSDSPLVAKLSQALIAYQSMRSSWFDCLPVEIREFEGLLPRAPYKHRLMPLDRPMLGLHVVQTLDKLAELQFAAGIALCSVPIHFDLHTKSQEA